MVALQQDLAPAAEPMYSVYSDMRWPPKTGIGFVMDAMVARMPSRLKLVDVQVQGGAGSPLSPWAFTQALRRAEARDGVVWSAGFVPPLYTALPTVVTVHDLTHLHFYSKAHRLYYNTVFRPLYRRCQAVVCVSDYTRHEFLAWSGMDPKRVHVVLNGVGPEFAANAQTLNLPFEYVLYPGNHRSYKNLDRLIRAYAASSLPGRGICLALTGLENPALTALAAQLGVAQQLRFLGRLPDADLPRVYRGALAVAYVSLYEGFGLPIVEAMASGTPVLTATVSSMPEVAGDAALLVDPRDVAAIAAGLDRLSTDAALRADLVARGRERVARFDWDQSARALWSLVDEVHRRG